MWTVRNTLDLLHGWFWITFFFLVHSENFCYCQMFFQPSVYLHDSICCIAPGWRRQRQGYLLNIHVYFPLVWLYALWSIDQSPLFPCDFPQYFIVIYIWQLMFIRWYCLINAEFSKCPRIVGLAVGCLSESKSQDKTWCVMQTWTSKCD